MASVRGVTLVVCLLAAASAFQGVQVMISQTKRISRPNTALCAPRASCNVTSTSTSPNFKSQAGILFQLIGNTFPCVMRWDE